MNDENERLTLGELEPGDEFQLRCGGRWFAKHSSSDDTLCVAAGLFPTGKYYLFDDTTVPAAVRRKAGAADRYADNEPAEKDPNGIAAGEPGAKLDDGKPWHYTALRGWYPITDRLFPGSLNLSHAVRKMIRTDSPTAAVLELSPSDIAKACDVGSYGARKYSRYGWARVPDAKNRYREAFGRHVVAFYLRGETRDADGLEHAGCIAWNLLALASLESGELDINELTEPEADS